MSEAIGTPIIMTVHWSRERPIIWAEAIYTFPLSRVWYVPAKPAEPCFKAVKLVARPINVEFVAQPIKLEGLCPANR